LVVLVAAAAPLVVAGTFFDPLLAIAVIYCLVLGVHVLFDALLLPRAGKVRIERIVPQRLSLGAAVPVELNVANLTRRRMLVELAEDLPAEIEAQPGRLSLTLAPGESRRIAYRLLARKRGRYQLDALDVRLLPARGLLYRQFRQYLATEVHVFPNLVNLKRYDLLLRRGLSAEQGLARLRQIGQGSEFESLRSYVEGDEMSRVDWKATARRARLIVKNRMPERQQSVLVAIDVGRATAGEFGGLSRLDYFVNATLMLAYVALRQGDWFSLVAFSDRIDSYLPPVRNVRSLDRVARALYELDAKLVEADYAAACRFLSLRNRKRSLICLMTDVIDSQASALVIAYMARFARQHLPLAVTLADPDLHTLAESPLDSRGEPYSQAAARDALAARTEALAAMRRLGVGVIDVYPPQLTPELINRYTLIKSTHRL
jgi:uncharacterized protein (DUF58 family)